MKTLKIFVRDLKLTLRDFMSLFIILIPIALAAVINMATPGITDSFLRVALPKDAPAQQIAFYEQYAAVELFDTTIGLQNRVMERDVCFGVLTDATGGTTLVTEGNEPQAVVDAMKLLKTYEEMGEMPSDNVRFTDFGRTTPPLKSLLMTGLLMLITILSGMLISLNIVNEKADHTIRAIQVAPVSTTSFVVGKSLIGVTYTLVSGFAILWIGGYLSVDTVLQLLMVLLASSFISFVIGFLVGLTSHDFIEAAGNVKIVMLPMIASILIPELMAAKWHFLVWWSPFYWSYDALKGLLNQTATMGRVFVDAGIVIAIATLLYLLLQPKIKQKLR